MNTERSVDQLIQSVVPEEEIEASECPEEASPDLSRGLDKHEVETLEQCLQEAKDTHGLRLDYTNRIFQLICVWLACVAASIFMSGFPCFGFKLSDKVLITFITSTTISVLGLFVIVAKWMFPNNHKKSK